RSLERARGRRARALHPSEREAADAGDGRPDVARCPGDVPAARAHFGGRVMKDLRDLQRMAQQMQASMEKAQAQLADETVEGTAGGGAVTVVMTGTQEVRGVRIAPDAVDPSDVETLQDLVLAAVKDALEKSKALAGQRLGGIAGGLGGLKLP